MPSATSWSSSAFSFGISANGTARGTLQATGVVSGNNSILKGSPFMGGVWLTNTSPNASSISSFSAAICCSVGSPGGALACQNSGLDFSSLLGWIVLEVFTLAENFECASVLSVELSTGACSSVLSLGFPAIVRPTFVCSVFVFFAVEPTGETRHACAYVLSISGCRTVVFACAGSHYDGVCFLA